MLKFTGKENTQIVIQVRQADNHIAASFRLEFRDSKAVEDALKACLANCMRLGILTCENLEFPFKLNGINIQFESK